MNSARGIIRRILGTDVSREQRLLGHALQLEQEVLQNGVPVLGKSHVTIDLKRLALALLHFLNFMAGPTRSSGFRLRHIQNSKARIGVPTRQVMKGILSVLLIANSKDEIFRSFGLRNRILNCIF